MYKDICDNSEFVADNADNDVLCISGDGPLVELYPLSKITRIEYPKHDVCSMPEIPSDSYVAVICDQVLEHVKQPFNAVDEIHRVLCKDGILFLTTVFMYPIHEYPKDYWRFTPDGLQELCKDFSTIIRFGGWGNQDMVKNIADKREAGMGVGSYADNDIKPLINKNNPDTPLVVWIIAKK